MKKLRRLQNMFTFGQIDNLQKVQHVEQHRQYTVDWKTIEFLNYRYLFSRHFTWT